MKTRSSFEMREPQAMRIWPGVRATSNWLKNQSIAESSPIRITPADWLDHPSALPSKKILAYH
ncbi:hypothetical protein, partial [Methylococcus capsulatus]|uniref:hypothetical protein n=1 Tax=Methylococcus capsulatus TaxID=414 RepID=UPI001B7FDB85